MDAACAIFVRAPGSLNGKTRLAHEIGTAKAVDAYRLSLMCCRDLALDLKERGVAVTWAVDHPESLNHEFWLDTNMETIYSGDGGLGDCLANVSGILHAKARRSILLGSDSPQLTIKDLEPVLAADAAPLIAGPANDGGFYLFSSDSPVDPGVWRQVSYSQPTTLKQLIDALGAPVQQLATRPDFDELSSLAEVVADMPATMSAAQEKFVRYARQIEDAA